jgi:hypothetical protein
MSINFHSVATIYRFFTPFSDLEKEEKFLQEVLKKIVSYLKSENIKLSFERKDTKRDILIIIGLEDFWRLIFFFRKINLFQMTTVDYALPIFEFDILFNMQFFLFHKKQIVNFLTNIFECFDWVNEKEYLIEMDKTVCYKKFFIKVCPHYDFQEVDKLQKQFVDKNGKAMLEEFLRNYYGKGFVLNKETADIYLTIHWNLLYLFYLLYTLYIVLYQTNKLSKDLKISDFKLVEYKANLTLFRERLKMLGDTTEDVFKKYLFFLEKFLNLFKE